MYETMRRLMFLYTREVRAAHEEAKGRYGAPRVHAQLRTRGKQHSRKRVV